MGQCYFTFNSYSSILQHVCKRLNVFTTCTQFATFDLVFIILWSVQVHGGCVPVERIDGVRVGKQLREERLKDVGEVWWM